MAYLTSIERRGVGLVEFFKNPSLREWRSLWREADPIDGVRGYLIGDDLIIWGSLPLHSDVRPMIEDEIANYDKRWIGVQINAALVTVLVSEAVDRFGVFAVDETAISAVRKAVSLLRLLGSGMIVRDLHRAFGPNEMDLPYREAL